ncbi:hypothetical protein [Lysobacter gummosus]|uniref:hypothetical protein n=1 Tax=Lysobacter gummosus TaxID=262324 RepID=UPI0036444D08
MWRHCPKVRYVPARARVKLRSSRNGVVPWPRPSPRKPSCIPVPKTRCRASSPTIRPWRSAVSACAASPKP